MPGKNSSSSQKLKLQDSQFADLFANLQVPKGMKLDASVMAALEQATNKHLNEMAERAAKSGKSLKESIDESLKRDKANAEAGEKEGTEEEKQPSTSP